MRAVLFGLVLAVGACGDDGPSVESAAEKVCTCMAPAGTSQAEIDMCTAELVAEAEDEPLTEECLSCIDEHSCEELAALACEPVCD